MNNTNYSLREHGDDLEKYGCEHFDLDTKFAEYEEFWKKYVVPATNRPNNYYLKQGIDSSYETLLITSHGVYRDLVFAEYFLKQMENEGCGLSLLNIQGSLIHDGNALQKTKELTKILKGTSQNCRDGAISSIMRRYNINFDRVTYDKLSLYRNKITHINAFAIERNNEIILPSLDYVSDYASLPWTQQETNFVPNKWKPYREVCEDVHINSIRFINQIYKEIIDKLDQIPIPERAILDSLMGQSSSVESSRLMGAQGVQGVQGVQGATT